MLAKHEMFEKFSDEETSEQGHIIKTTPCWANMLVNIASSLMNFMFVHLIYLLIRSRTILNMNTKCNLQNI